MRIFLKPHNGFFTSNDAAKKQAEILKVVHLEVFQSLGLPAVSGPNLEDLSTFQQQAVKSSILKCMLKIHGCENLMNVKFRYTVKTDRILIHAIELIKIAQTHVKEI